MPPEPSAPQCSQRRQRKEPTPEILSGERTDLVSKCPPYILVNEMGEQGENKIPLAPRTRGIQVTMNTNTPFPAEDLCCGAGVLTSNDPESGPWLQQAVLCRTFTGLAT